MNARRILVGISVSVLGALPSSFSAVLEQLSSGDVRVFTHLREIDSSAVAALKQHFSDDRRLADRGTPFRAGDVSSARNPPSRRLVLAAASGDTWFIHYEHGGAGRHSHLVALARSGRSWRVVYAASAFYEYGTLKKLRAAIRTRQFREKSYEL